MKKCEMLLAKSKGNLLEYSRIKLVFLGQNMMEEIIVVCCFRYNYIFGYNNARNIEGKQLHFNIIKTNTFQ
jgi:hypothetical protein